MNKKDSKTKASPDYYDQGIKQNLGQRWWHLRRFAVVREVLSELDLKTEVLDIGCHGGRFTQEMASFLPEVKMAGIDPDQEAIAYARKRLPDFSFKEAFVENLPFRDESFDLVTCLEVLEHVSDPQKAVSEMRRCLKKDGCLVVMVPTESLLFQAVWFLWTKNKGKIWQEAHLHQFRDERLENLLAENGFEVEKSQKSHWGMIKTVKARKKR